jgi:hypothetical protein
VVPVPSFVLRNLPILQILQINSLRARYLRRYLRNTERRLSDQFSQGITHRGRISGKLALDDPCIWIVSHAYV